jgi:hypothetical protein
MDVRLDGIVPFAVKGSPGQVESRKFFVRDLDASRIDVTILDGRHR